MSDVEVKLDKNLVLNKDLLLEIEDDVTCSICNGIIIDSLQCKTCGACFCNYCYNKGMKEFILKKEKGLIDKNGYFPCPCSMKNNLTSMNNPINNCLIERMLKKLKFSCDKKKEVDVELEISGLDVNKTPFFEPIYMDILKDTLKFRYNVQCIVVTHSPSIIGDYRDITNVLEG